MREDALRRPPSSKSQVEYEELEEAKRDLEGTDFSYDTSTPSMERPREIERIQEREIVHEIMLDLIMDR